MRSPENQCFLIWHAIEIFHVTAIGRVTLQHFAITKKIGYYSAITMQHFHVSCCLAFFTNYSSATSLHQQWIWWLDLFTIGLSCAFLPRTISHMYIKRLRLYLTYPTQQGSFQVCLCCQWIQCPIPNPPLLSAKKPQSNVFHLVLNSLQNYLH